MTKFDFNIFSSIFNTFPPQADEIEENQAPFSPDSFRDGAKLILIFPYYSFCRVLNASCYYTLCFFSNEQLSKVILERL